MDPKKGFDLLAIAFTASEVNKVGGQKGMPGTESPQGSFHAHGQARKGSEVKPTQCYRTGGMKPYRIGNSFHSLSLYSLFPDAIILVFSKVTARFDRFTRNVPDLQTEPKATTCMI